jgi:putative copper export protein
MELTDPFLAGGRAVQLAGLGVLIGAATSTWLAPSRAVARPARAAAVLLLLGLAIQLVGQLRAFDAFGPEADPLSTTLGIIASISWGRNRLALAALAVSVLATAGMARPWGDRLLRATALITVLLLPALGHAAAVEDGALRAWVQASVHAAGAGLWLGTLALLAPAWWHDVKSVQGAIARYGRLALVAAPVTVLSGVVTAWPRVGGVAGLLQPGYGQLVLAKLGLAVALLGLGALHHRRLVRAQQSPTKATLLLELLVAGAVLCVTGVLAESAPVVE